MGDSEQSGLLDGAVVPPSADKQIEFLVNIQRLLKEGAFVATYKYALLTAIADLSVENGDDSGGPLTLQISDIAEKFISYYWRQSIPYIPMSAALEAKSGRILQQNTGSQAEIIGRSQARAFRWVGPAQGIDLGKEKCKIGAV